MLRKTFPGEIGNYMFQIKHEKICAERFSDTLLLSPSLKFFQKEKHFAKNQLCLCLQPLLLNFVPLKRPFVINFKIDELCARMDEKGLSLYISKIPADFTVYIFGHSEG
eukprot:UN21031